MFLFLFFLLILDPPRSTLFPYTTLFRSVGLWLANGALLVTPACALFLLAARWRRAPAGAAPPRGQQKQRSEEHTSELQSLAYLVCRLLLEKKKKQKARM